MKCKTYAHKIVDSHQKNVHEDSPICARAQGINVLSRNETHARTFTHRARAQMGESTHKYCGTILSYEH